MSEDTTTVVVLNDLAWGYRTFNLDSSIYFANKGLEIARKIGYIRGQANSWNRIGNVQEAYGKFEIAEKAYFEALSLDNRISNSYGKARDYHQIGVVYGKKGEFQESINYKLKSIEILNNPSENKKKSKARAAIYNSIGNDYKHLGKYKEAIKYFREGLSIREKLRDSVEISKSLNEIALIYEYMKMYDTALELHKRSLEISSLKMYLPGKATSLQNIGNIYSNLFDFEQAIIYYNECLTLKSSFTDKVDYQDLIHNLGILYLRQGEYQKALNHFDQSLEIRLGIKNPIKIADSYYQIGLVEYGLGEYQKALDNFRKAENTLSGQKSPLLSAMIFEKTAYTYTLLNDSAKALEYFLIYSNLKDSLSEQEILAIEYDNKLLASQNKLKISEKELSLEKSKDRNKTLVFSLIFGGAILCLIALTILILNLKNKQRAIIAEQEVRIREKEIDDLLRTQELKLMTAVLNGQDEERYRIASDLHDRLGGILSVAKLHFKTIEKSLSNLEAKNVEQYQIVRNLLNDATETVREISYDIGDSLLLNLGLMSAIEDLASIIESSNELSVVVVNYGYHSRLSKEIEISLYKVFQELFSNILKHGKARDITLNFLKTKDHLSITVEDDGQGFDPNSVDYKEGLGMLSMRSRIEELNGLISFDSQTGHGTTVTIEIPLKTICKNTR